MIRQHCGCSVTPPLVLCHTGDILHRTPSVRGLGHWSRRGERTPCPVSLFGPVWGLPEEPTGFCFTQGTTLSRPKAGVVMVKGRFSKAFKGKWTTSRNHSCANKRHVWSQGGNLSASPPSSKLLKSMHPYSTNRPPCNLSKCCPTSLLCSQWNSCLPCPHEEISKPSHRIHLLTWCN